MLYGEDFDAKSEDSEGVGGEGGGGEKEFEEEVDAEEAVDTQDGEGARVREVPRVPTVLTHPVRVPTVHLKNNSHHATQFVNPWHCIIVLFVLTHDVDDGKGGEDEGHRHVDEEPKREAVRDGGGETAEDPQGLVLRQGYLILLAVGVCGSVPEVGSPSEGEEGEEEGGCESEGDPEKEMDAGEDERVDDPDAEEDEEGRGEVELEQWIRLCLEARFAPPGREAEEEWIDALHKVGPPEPLTKEK